MSKGKKQRTLGTIEDRGNGVFLLRVTKGYKVNDKGKNIPDRVNKTIKARNKSEAERELSKFYTEVTSEGYRDPWNITFAKFSEYFLEQKLADGKLKPTTYQQYGMVIKRHLLPEFGNIKIKKITTLMLDSFLTKLKKEGKRKERTLQNIGVILSVMFSYAFRKEVINHNPMLKVDRIKISPENQKVNNYLTEAQMGLYYEALSTEDIRYRTFFLLAVFTGLRKGELLGLEWSDININGPEDSYLNVKRNMQYTKLNGNYLCSPKTYSAVRVVPLVEEAQKLLQEYRAFWVAWKVREGEAWKAGNAVFVNCQSLERSYTYAAEKWLSRFIEKHGLPHITIHGLRHTFATQLIKNGAVDMYVAALLGHADGGETVRKYYAHVSEDGMRETAKILHSQMKKGKLFVFPTAEERERESL